MAETIETTALVGGVPVDDPDIARVIVDASAIEDAIEQLAALVALRMREFSVFVPVATGGCAFASDLLRHVYVTQRAMREGDGTRAYDRPVVACAMASSYGDGTVSGGATGVTTPGAATVRGKRVCVLEDIIDTGKTAMAIAEALYAAGAEEVAIIALMDKQARRDATAQKYFEDKNMKMACAFLCPDEFVVGYGMDYQGKYRELPFVGVLKPEIFGASGEK